MTTIARFAPSPTGLLHVGNARTALVTWLHARAARGRFILRLDDTDTERSRPEFVEAIRRDLTWLGLTWDEEHRQSDRVARYADAIATLKASGDLYACYETPEELALKRKALLAQHRPPIYDRAALALSDAERRQLEADGRRPHWRFKMRHQPIVWRDLVRGEVRFEGGALSDPVVIREDGRPLYHLCSVLDDIDFGITHVVRGEDHVANTAAHAQMFEALGATPPAFAHLPLIADAAGRGLSKRAGSASLAALRDEEGLEPMAISSLLARLGTSDPIEPVTSLDALVASFDFAKFARATPRFDADDLPRLNAHILHAMPFETATGRLTDLGLTGADRAFWDAVRPNLTRLRDAAPWWQVVAGPVNPVVDDAAYLETAAALLPAAPLTEDSWKTWTAAVKEATGRKGRALFLPLRQALTGHDHGPEMAALLPLIGRDRALERLQGVDAPPKATG